MAQSKNFSDSLTDFDPTFAFLSFQEDVSPAPAEISKPAKEKKTAPASEPAQYKEQPQEVKTRRVQLVFRPSTYKAATAKAKKLKISLNEYLHRLIEEDNK